MLFPKLLSYFTSLRSNCLPEHFDVKHLVICVVSHASKTTCKFTVLYKLIPIFSVSKSTVFAVKNNTHFQNFFLSWLRHNVFKSNLVNFIKNLTRQVYLYRLGEAQHSQSRGEEERRSGSSSCFLCLFAALNGTNYSASGSMSRSHGRGVRDLQSRFKQNLVDWQKVSIHAAFICICIPASFPGLTASEPRAEEGQ